MKNTPEISLIVPIYNVEKYLVKALVSIENQTFKNFEAILVDDGSTDKSIEIIKKFCDKNENFKFIQQENRGPAAARNAALEISTGKYIAFMDSDDFIEPEFLERMYTAAEENNADIACCNFKLYYPEKDAKVQLPLNSIKGIYTKKQALKKLILDVRIHYFVWNKLIKRNLISDNNFKFDEMYFEDISASPKLFFYANKIVVISDALYNYTSRETSILHSINTAKVNDFIKSLGSIRNFLENKNAYKDYNTHLWLYSQKVKFVSYYYILMIHAKAMNFNKFLENLNSATKSISYFSGNIFIPTKEDVPKILFPIKEPPKKIKVRVKKSKKNKA